MEKSAGSIVEQIRDRLMMVEDPELGFSIIDLGLVYDIACDEHGVATILMTLTSPACPSQVQIEKGITEALRALPPVTAVNITITFSPRWSAEKVSASARQQMALMGIPLTRW